MTRAALVRARRARARHWEPGPNEAIIVRRKTCGCVLLRTGSYEAAERLVAAGRPRELRILRLTSDEALEAEAQSCGRCPDRPKTRNEEMA